MHIFCQKNVNSLKTAVLSYNFFQILHEKTPRAVLPIFGPKTQFYQNYTILWAKKVKKICLFIYYFNEISLLSRPYFVKKRPISEKQTDLIFPYFVKKR